MIAIDAVEPKTDVRKYHLLRSDFIYFYKNGNAEISGIKEMDLMPSPKTKIYINGKLSAKEEMDKLNPNDIATVNVNKNVNNGKEEGEIRIQTK